MKVLKYPSIPDITTESETERRIQQLALLAKALATEVDTLQAELYRDRRQQIDFDKDGLDFYEEVERYEIELIIKALQASSGNQTQAAKLLRMKSTTLNAKMKHYGLTPVRSIPLRPANIQASS